MKCEITYRLSKIRDSTYEGVQTTKFAAGFQPATLLKINSLIDIKQIFQKRIHRNLPQNRKKTLE